MYLSYQYLYLIKTNWNFKKMYQLRGSVGGATAYGSFALLCNHENPTGGTLC